jgi:hypothetical protein
VILTTTLAIWYLLFGPIYSNWLDVCSALGFALLLRESVVTQAKVPSSLPDAQQVGRAAPSRGVRR